MIRKRIRKRDGYCCRACGIAVRAGVVDHIKPLAQGGSNSDENLQLLCKECHDDKTNADQGYWSCPCNSGHADTVRLMTPHYA
ncbi:HNH endonuclease [Burkholderia cenocepacia]|uniref:HNH endonuclease n=1 Tax=Burkholderia cenocepacia TaxID=95486 RepID=UPI002445F506|nr:HNH endonuclease signature motif containing protein [Burkholderia cenocepacia]